MSDPRKPLIPPPGSGRSNAPSRGRYAQQGDPGTPNIQNLPNQGDVGKDRIRKIPNLGTDSSMPKSSVPGADARAGGLNASNDHAGAVADAMKAHTAGMTPHLTSGNKGA